MFLLINDLSKPERQVHAKGFGAHGYFEVTTDIGAKLSMADFLSEVGKRTSVTSRLSTIAGSLGAADAVRDLRGLTFKYGQPFRRVELGVCDLIFCFCQTSNSAGHSGLGELSSLIAT